MSESQCKGVRKATCVNRGRGGMDRQEQVDSLSRTLRKYSVVGTRIIIIIENLLGFTTLRLYSDLTNKGPRSSYVCAASPVLNEAMVLPVLICLYPLIGARSKAYPWSGV